MNSEERELTRQQLHKIDLLLRQLKRKGVFLIEQIGTIQGTIIDIEEEKRIIYDLLDKK